MAAKVRAAPASDPIVEAARKKWQSSGLTDDQAKKLGLTPMRGEAVSKLSEKFHAVGAMMIPYFTMEGKRTEFYRIRYLEKLPGAAGVVEKPQRYAQLPGSLNEVYFPPILPRTWADIAKDANVTIFITEGEFKAASACGAGLACLGLGGVDVWRSTKRGIGLLPALEKIEWKNRPVVICYDSDAAINLNVVRAQRQLSKELIAHGAIPAVLSLPAAKDGSKQGLDDYLVANGVDALEKLIEDAPMFPEADALWGLNEEVLYVRDPGLVVELGTGYRIQPNRFVGDAYANRHYIETTQGKGGVLVAKKKPLARRWIEWEHRAEVDSLTYLPGQPRLVDGKYNMWKGWGCEPIKGDVSYWKWLLDFLFASDPAHRDWFERWCAYPIQNPGAKMYSSSMFWGREKGTGKSFVFYALQGIYGANSIEINNKDLRGSFNGWAKNRQFIHGNEISGAEARVDADWLKGIITQPDVQINEKYLPTYVMPDCMNYGFTSNHPDALFVEDGDRRYFVHEIVGPPAPREFYERLHKWLHGDGKPGSYAGQGASHLFHHLLNVNLKDFNPREHAPLTNAKRNMIINGKSDVAMWVVQLREDPLTALKPVGARASKDCELFTPSVLLRAYDPEGNKRVTANGMSRELVKAGFRQINAGSPIRTKVGLVRLYAVRNGDQWKEAPPKDAAKHWETFFGEGAGKF